VVDPRRENELVEELRHDQQAWIASAISSAKPVLDDAIKVLCEAGFSRCDINFACSDPMDSRESAVPVLNLARAIGCHTIVIGHESHSWFRKLTGSHLAEYFLRHASDIALWVVQ
jgi:hypothetical protein